MSDVNMVMLSGRLCADPQLRFTPKGTAVASLRLASNHNYRDKSVPEGEWRKKTVFITACVFGQFAEVIAANKKKGDQILVTGRLDPNDWKDKEGVEHKTLQIFTDHVNFLGASRKPGENEASSHEESASFAGSGSNEKGMPRSGKTSVARSKDPLNAPSPVGVGAGGDGDVDGDEPLF